MTDKTTRSECCCTSFSVDYRTSFLAYRIPKLLRNSIKNPSFSSIDYKNALGALIVCSLINESPPPGVSDWAIQTILSENDVTKPQTNISGIQCGFLSANDAP